MCVEAKDDPNIPPAILPIIDAAQVTVTKAKPSTCNGVYEKNGTRNDRGTFENASGACIYYNKHKKSWMLSRTGKKDECDYAVQSEDVAPPDGQWHCHCAMAMPVWDACRNNLQEHAS